MNFKPFCKYFFKISYSLTMIKLVEFKPLDIIMTTLLAIIAKCGFQISDLTLLYQTLFVVYRSGTLNSNTVNSKFHLIRSFFEILATILSFHV